MGSKWGFEVVGKKDTPVQQIGRLAGGAVNNLSGLVKRKRAPDGESNGGASPGSDGPASKVNVLGAGLIRKKKAGDATVTSGEAAPVLVADTPMTDIPEAPKINVLTAGLVRKKPKAS